MDSRSVEGSSASRSSSADAVAATRDALEDLGAALSLPTERHALAALLTAAARELEADFAALCRLSGEASHAELLLEVGGPRRAQWLGLAPPARALGEPAPGVFAWEGPPPAELMAAASLDQGQRSALSSLRAQGRGWASMRDDVPCLAVPIARFGRGRGALLFARTQRPLPFDDGQLTYIETLASLISVSEERARQASLLRRQERREEQLSGLVAVLHQVEIASEAQAAVVRSLPKAVELDIVRIHAPSTPGGPLELQASSSSEPMGTFAPTFIGDALATGEVQVVMNLERAAGTGDALLDPHGLLAATVFPLGGSGAALSVWYRSYRGPSDEERSYLEHVCHHLGEALTRISAQAASRRNERLFHETVAHSPVPLLVYDASGRLRVVSRRMGEITGHDATVFSHVSEWLDVAFPQPEARDEFDAALERARVADSEVLDLGEHHVACADGSTRQWSFLLRRTEQPDAPPLFHLAALDITERRGVEEQLRHAQKMEAIGQLSAGLAHNFRNSLQVVLGFAELARAQVDEGSPLESMLREIISAANRDRRVTNTLLAFSTRKGFRTQPSDLNEILDSFLQSARHLISDPVRMVRDTETPLPPVLVDTAIIEEALLNLVINARDAMPRGGTIRFRTQVVRAGESPDLVGGPPLEADRLAVFVSDDGIGMSAEVRQRIFEPFFTTRELEGGTGLGLAGVYGSMGRLGGGVRVASEEGVGTTFALLLPLADRSPQAKPEERAGELPGGTETILLADDRRALRDYVAAALRDRGYTVHCAADGAAALELVRRLDDEIDLALFDVFMPRLGGIEAAQILQRLRPETRLLFMSGAETEGEPPAGSARLTKPFGRAELLETVRAMLDRARP